MGQRATLAIAAADEAVTLSRVLTDIAAELERARAIGMRVERAACLLALKFGADAELVHDLQQLDEMLQHVAAMRDLLEALSHMHAELPAHGVAAAIDRISLSAVRSRLRGEDAESGEAEDGWELL